MADTKVSALVELAVEPAATDEFYINDGGVSKKILWSTLETGMWTSPVISGDIVREIASGEGDKIGTVGDNAFGWRDITGAIEVRGIGATSPTFNLVSGSIFRAYQFDVNDEVWILFHIPHDYVPGTDIYFHAHWLANGTNVQPVKWEWTFVYADGFGNGNLPVAAPTTVTAEEAATGTAHDHMVTESAATTVAGMEVDGVIYSRVRRITNGATDNTDGIFLLTTDIHYQSTNLATKNKAPNFYT